MMVTEGCHSRHTGHMPWSGEHQRDTARASGQSLDFFISYSVADERWAVWVAWTLESAGYTTRIQAWDFVAGSDFVSFMDDGVRDARMVVTILSRTYLESSNCKAEWRAAYRTDPGKLIPIRITDVPVDGLLATITWLDLLGVDNEAQAAQILLRQIRQTLAGRAKPLAAPGFPTQSIPATVSTGHELTDRRPRRRLPTQQPVFPPSAPPPGRRESISVLHVPGPRFGRTLGHHGPPTAQGLQHRIHANVSRLTDQGVPWPDLVIVTGDLMESAKPRELREALDFLKSLRATLRLEPHRVIVLPGGHDISKSSCLSYFAHCDTHDRTPVEPYFAKLVHYETLFNEFYQGIDNLVFDRSQPWTLFDIPDLHVVVAGFNSTIAMSHRPDDDFGWIGDRQAAWFADQLRAFEGSRCLRIGALCHDPVPGERPVDADHTLLRDASTLDRLLGRHLNLLLHGPGTGGGEVGFLGSGVPALPASDPGADELVVINQAGLTRYRWANDEPAVERIELDLSDLTATFATSRSVHEAPDPGPMAIEVESAGDPASLLLAKVTEICETRFDNVKIRRVHATPPHLILTTIGEINTQRRVGCHVGELTREIVLEFLSHEPGHNSELVYQGPHPTQTLRDEAARHGLRLRSFPEFQGLLDLSSYVGAQTQRLRTDPNYPPDGYITQRFRDMVRPEGELGTDLAEELVRAAVDDRGRFVLVLGDFGRGKTFVLREVARRIAESSPHLIPILIELRALDKAHTIEGLVAAHLANHGEPLSHLPSFDYMLREGRIVLLFDGFDELITRLTFDRATDHLDNLLRAATGKSKIILTSRTQHFRSDQQVFTKLGEQVGMLSTRRILEVQDFSSEQIRSYLVQRYDGDQDSADERFRQITEIQDLLGLSRNPRMLSFIADLPAERLRAAAHQGNTVSAARLYREILTYWLGFEAERTRRIRGRRSLLDESALWQAVTRLALRMWETGESYLRLGELEDVAEALTQLGDNRLTRNQVAFTIGSASLLSRIEGELFGFIHYSVAEWLVAQAIATTFNEGTAAPPELGVRELSSLTVDFLCDLADPTAIRDWVTTIKSDGGVDRIILNNALKVDARLRTSATANLRDAILRDQDLSSRDFSNADLSGADLTNAVLANTNLTNANLRNAILVNTRFDHCRLTNADLRGADLTRARLTKVDLTGVRVTDSVWTRAAVIDPIGPPTSVETAIAAVAPGDRVETAFAPAAVGVKHGFHADKGRLPHVLDYSPDGSTLAIGSDDGGVLIVDTATGHPIRTLVGHRGRVFAVSFGNDVLVTGSADGKGRLWDSHTGRLISMIDGHDEWVWPSVVDRTRDELITGDSSGVLRIYDLSFTRAAEGRVERSEPITPRLELPADRGLIYSVVTYRDRLAATYIDGSVLLWDIETGDKTGELDRGTGSVYRAAVNAEGTLLATGGSDGAVRLWTARDGWPVAELPGHSGRVYTVAFHPTRPLLAAGDTDGGLRIWDIERRTPAHILTGHDASIYWTAFDPAGVVLASADSAGDVRLWDARTGTAAHRLTGHTGSVWPFAFRGDGAQLATSDDQFSTRLWNVRTGLREATLSGHGRQVTRVAFSADGDRLVTSGKDGVIRLWNPRTGRQTRRLEGPPGQLVTMDSAAFCPRHHRLAAAANDGRINLFNSETGALERHLNIESAPVWALTFSPSGEEVVTANDDDTVGIWYRTTGRRVRTLAEHKGRVRSIAYSPDGALIATGCDDCLVRLWDAETGVLIRTLRGHEDRVYAVDFGDGVLASASWDTTVRIWDVTTGECRHRIVRHRGRLSTLAFAPDGRLLATAGEDLVIRLWNAQEGLHLQTELWHTRTVWSLAFSPDGTLLASGSEDGSTRLWKVNGNRISRSIVLLGLAEGWAATDGAGRYKFEGETAGAFWHTVGMSRFEKGELNNYLEEVRRLPLDHGF